MPSNKHGNLTTSNLIEKRTPAAELPVRHPGVPRRQRLGIHQPAGRPAAGETAYRVHQVPRPAQQRQRPGGMQERSCRAQAARPCPYPATLGRPTQ